MAKEPSYLDNVRAHLTAQGYAPKLSFYEVDLCGYGSRTGVGSYDCAAQIIANRQDDAQAQAAHDGEVSRTMPLSNAQRQARHRTKAAYVAERARTAAEIYREALAIIVLNATLQPDASMGGTTDCYAVPTDDIDAARRVLGLDSATVLLTDENRGYDVIGPLDR